MNFDFKKKDKFYVIITSIVILILVWAFVSAFFITRSFKRDAALNKFDNKKVSVEDLLLTQTKDGKKYWEIYAEKGYYEDNEKIAYVTNSIGNFYQEEQVVASFQSPRATINSETGQIMMYDRSKLIYKDFTSIVANEFNYDGKDKPIIAKGNVIIENPNKLYLTGDSAVLSDNMTKISVKGKVLTKIYEEKGK